MSLIKHPGLSKPHSVSREQVEIVLFYLWSHREILCDMSKIAQPVLTKVKRGSKPTVLHS